MTAGPGRPLRVLLGCGDPDGIAREFARRGFEVRIAADRAEVLQGARDRSADLFLLHGPCDSAETLLLADQLQTIFPGLAGRILLIPEGPPVRPGEVAERLTPVLRFLAAASDRLGSGEGRCAREGRA
ncbi:MAG: hypothetical protein HY509_03255 [Acidobacteria bacterium]|nr:hypothetical protein [Acidobacteriota bacterium]